LVIKWSTWEARAVVQNIGYGIPIGINAPIVVAISQPIEIVIFFIEARATKIYQLGSAVGIERVRTSEKLALVCESVVIVVRASAHGGAGCVGAVTPRRCKSGVGAEDAKSNDEDGRG